MYRVLRHENHYLSDVDRNWVSRKEVIRVTWHPSCLNSSTLIWTALRSRIFDQVGTAQPAVMAEEPPALRIGGRAADGFVQRRRRHAKASGLCWPLSLQNQHMFSHMAQQTRKGITVFCTVLHALCKGRMHCWMIINPQCICYHLKRFWGACWACNCYAGESRGRMLSAAGCSRE